MGEKDVVPLERNESLIDYQILTPSSSGIDSFVDIINSEWGNFFPLNKYIFSKRLESGHLFIGAYQNNRPAGILETISLNIEESKEVLMKPVKERAREVCSKIKGYDSLTNFGEWTHFSGYPNVLVLVDITVDPLNRKTPVASGIVDFGKFFMLNPEKRPVQMDCTEYVVTLTPNITPVKRWHERLGAFDTELVLENARPNYKVPDVNFMCYLAPHYKPSLGQQLGKAA